MKNKKSIAYRVGEAIGAAFMFCAFIVLATLVILLTPLLSFVIGYTIGLMIELVSGDLVSNGLNLIFNTDRYHKGDLPTVLSTIFLFVTSVAMIVSYHDKKDEK